MSRFYVAPPAHPPRGFHAVPDAELNNPDSTNQPIDWSGLEQAAAAATDWLLTTLRTRTTDPEDLAAIDRVDRRLRAGVTVDESDALVVVGLAIDVFERVLGIPGLSAVAGQVFDVMSSAPAPAVDSNRPSCTDGACAARPRATLVCAPRGPRLAYGGVRPRPSILQLVVG